MVCNFTSHNDYNYNITFSLKDAIMSKKGIDIVISPPIPRIRLKAHNRIT